MKRKVELFTAGCPVCEEATRLVKELVCENCDLEILNTVNDRVAQEKAKKYGLSRLPAVVVNGRIAECCTQKIDADTLRAAGVGVR